MASAPAMVVTIAMTIESRGRSTKIDESIGLTPAERPAGRACPHSGSRSHPLQPVDDDLLTAGEAVLHDHVGPALAPDLDAPHGGLTVLDDEHVNTALVGDQCGLRHDDLLCRGSALKKNPHQLAIAKGSLGVGHCRTCQNGIDAPVDADIDKIDPTDLIIGHPLGKLDLDLDFAG